MTETSPQDEMVSAHIDIFRSRKQVTAFTVFLRKTLKDTNGVEVRERWNEANTDFDGWAILPTGLTSGEAYLQIGDYQGELALTTSPNEQGKRARTIDKLLTKIEEAIGANNIEYSFPVTRSTEYQSR